MKALVFLPPAVSLAVAAVWLGGQRRGIATLEQEITVLREKIGAARLAASSDGAADAAKEATAKADAPDWKHIAGELGRMGGSGGMPDMRAMIRLQKQVLSMSEEEIITALDEIAALDLDATRRMMLDNLLIGAVADKNPELVLTRFRDRINDSAGAMSWQLSQALEKWAVKDPAAATAWFDREIAAGTFDSRSLDGKAGPRPQFERAFLSALLSNNPELVGRRIAELPDEQRTDTLRSMGAKEENQKTLAGLVRQHVPADEQAGLIADQMLATAHDAKYDAATAYLDRIEATPEERAAAVDKVVERRFAMFSERYEVNRESIDELRTWADGTAPGSADRATGQALAAAMNRIDSTSFSELATLATEYHEAGGGDDVIIPLVDHWRARNHKEEARELANRISDEKRRTGILEKLQ